MEALAIRLLGLPSLELQGGPAPIAQRKALALIAYLALSGRPQPRETLAGLLWPALAPAKAATNLRHVAWLLRRAGLAPWLDTSRAQLALREGFWLDVAAFEAQVGAGRAAEALALYRGELLAGHSYPDAPAFAAWLEAERERLRQLRAALPQPQVAGGPALLATTPRPRDGPRPATSFVGRSAELAEVESLLARPSCRLLTIIGLGGVGKTRLALEALERAAPFFADGVSFVSLQGVTAPGDIPAAVAEAIGLRLQGQAPPWEQLGDALRERAMLLILDNLEQLLAGGEALAALLGRAPQLKLLVTSREAIGLREEWLLPLAGLPHEASGADGERRAPAAIQLFRERAQQVRRAGLPGDEEAAIELICRLVDGIPLAIELAAAWTKALSCTEIAAEIGRGAAILSSGLRNLPERHRSMQAVFDQVWARLPAAERAVWARLSVFRGGFTAEAAQQVAGASVAALAPLIDQSLLRRDRGRYRFHELIRHYGAERLGESAAEASAAEAAYGRAVLQFLLAQYERLTAGQQHAAVIALAAELENIRAAWPSIVRQADCEALRRAALLLAKYYFVCGPYHEGREMFTLVAEHLGAAPPSPEGQVLLACIRVHLGYLGIRTGDLAVAAAEFTESVALLAAAGAPPPPEYATDPAIGLGVLALTRGDYGAAARLGEEVRARSEAHGLAGNLPYAWYLLTEAAWAQGLYGSAQQSAKTALRAVERSGDAWLGALIRTQLGQIAAARGNDAEAEQQFAAAAAIHELFGDTQGMSRALLELGRLALRRGDVGHAAERFAQCLGFYRQTGDRGGAATALDELGAVALARGDHAEARRYLQEALAVATAIAFDRLSLTIIGHCAELLLAAGQPLWAFELLTAVLRHPASSNELCELAQQLVLRCAQAAPQGQVAAAAALAQPLALEVLVLSTHDGLASLDLSLQPSPAAGAGQQRGLIEPLSGRELAILALMAAGRSNQEIAAELFLSVGTIKWYSGQIYGKLGVRTRAQAVAQAHRLSLLA